MPIEYRNHPEEVAALMGREAAFLAAGAKPCNWKLGGCGGYLDELGNHIPQTEEAAFLAEAHRLHAAFQAVANEAGGTWPAGVSSPSPVAPGNLAQIEVPAPFADRYEEAMSWARIYAENAHDMLKRSERHEAWHEEPATLIQERASLYAQVSMALSSAFRRPQ